MKKMIYVRDEDKDLFEEAMQYGEDSLSQVIAEALRRYVAAKKAESEETLEIGTWRDHGANDVRKIAFIDDLRISSIARSDEEILAAYQSGQPLQRDEDTTYLLTFNGSIYPVEMCWVPLGTFWSLDWDSPDDTLEATVTARDRAEKMDKEEE